MFGSWVTGGSSTNISNLTHVNKCLFGPGIRNQIIKTTVNASSHNMFMNHWHNGNSLLHNDIKINKSHVDIQRQYWAASFLLPIGSIVILAIVVLLMILFKRYPHMVVAVVAGILSMIVVFATFASLSHSPVYD